MDYSEATTERYFLLKELNVINSFPDSNLKKVLNLQKLIQKEILRLSDDIGAPMFRPELYDAFIPEEREKMLSQIPNDFHLNSTSATEAFAGKLKSELHDLVNEFNANFPSTYRFIRKVIYHTEIYLKKQKQSEYAVFGSEGICVNEYWNIHRTRDHKWLILDMELKQIKGRDGVDLLVELAEKEVLHLQNDDNDVSYLETRFIQSVPNDYGLVCGKDIISFREKLCQQLENCIDLDIPVTMHFIQTVISYADAFYMEKHMFEVAVFGGGADLKGIWRDIFDEEDNEANGLRSSESL